jgi:arabinogalactan oligomer/maltooligosaccharide transport system permease protein
MGEKMGALRKYLPTALWIGGLIVLYLILRALFAPHASGINLSSKMILARIREISLFLGAIAAVMIVIEVYFYQIFFRRPPHTLTTVIVRLIQGIFGLITVLLIIAFFDLTDLIRLPEGPFKSFVLLPVSGFAAFQKFLAGTKLVAAGQAPLGAAVLLLVVLGLLFFLIQRITEPRVSRVGLAYLLVIPALVGVLFLIIYPFLFEIKLAFSNASLGTQATKNASYGLQYGWQNLVTLFTGNVAKDAKFFEVLGRTVLWTVINVTFHVTGGMVLALLLHRPMKLQGFYRTLLVFPWAIPTTIAAMALRNEFDLRYGFFNIMLNNIHNFFASLSTKVALLSPVFSWLAANIGPVSWKQDPFWAFVSILISNIWLGIPFMAVIILGGLQSISHEYYEAAEMDGANKWQMFRNITLPLLRPVLTPAVILGVIWTFNKFDVIWLITQGGPQEKTDILVSSMYKAAFQFYRYGFTAMFALVIFFILLGFTIVYLRVTGGLKSATE